jgi:hypothetical protein
MTDQSAMERVKQDLLSLGDFAYQRLRKRVRGLTDDEYFWEPAPGCFSVRPVGNGTYRMDGGYPVTPAPLTTIAWRMCHLIDHLASERNATWIGLTPSGNLDRAGEPGTAKDAIRQLEQAWELFRRHIASADAQALTVHMGPIAGQWGGDTRTAFILHELDELIHHGAEVATLRDLYRATRPVEPFTSPGSRLEPS